MNLYAAEHAGKVYGIGDTYERAKQDARRHGYEGMLTFRSIDVAEAKRVASSDGGS